jgi:peptidoglycan hydrolase-like protein with peptidoglycan-binding domain
MTMKKLLLATVASMALTVPALAQNAPAQDQTQPPTQMQQQPAQPQQGMGGAAISPQRLSRTEVRHIQQALDTKGFKTRSSDGRWGPETEAALRKFQQQQNIQGDGQLNHETLAALGVNLSNRSMRSTTGAAPRESGSGGMNGQPADNNMNAQPPASGSNSGGMGQ